MTIQEKTLPYIQVNTVLSGIRQPSLCQFAQNCFLYCSACGYEPNKEESKLKMLI